MGSAIFPANRKGTPALRKTPVVITNRANLSTGCGITFVSECALDGHFISFNIMMKKNAQNSGLLTFNIFGTIFLGIVGIGKRPYGNPQESCEPKRHTNNDNPEECHRFGLPRPRLNFICIS